MSMPDFMQSSKPRMEYVPGRIMVRVKEDAVREALGAARLAMTATSAARLPDVIAEPLNFLHANAGLKEVNPLFSTRASALRRVRTSAGDRSRLAAMTSVADSESEDLRGINMMELSANEVTPQLIRHINRSRGVEYAELVPARWIMSAPAVGPLLLDPRLSLQWGLHAIGWFQVAVPDASAVTVAVLDTGVDTIHDDLQNLEIDYHHSGFQKLDQLGHGTHVVGTIAAATNGSRGYSGMAHPKLAVWKIFPDQPASDRQFYVDDMAYSRALNEVRNSGAKVLNLSIGGPRSSQTEQILFRRLADAGVFVAAAMGNEFKQGNRTSYPGAYDTVTAVGAISSDMRRADFSNTGSHIKLVAPGVSILSTLPMRKSNYRADTVCASWDGTSMATPHVSGMAALILAKRPGLSPIEVQQRLIQSARKLSDLRGQGWSEELGFGLPFLPDAL